MQLNLLAEVIGGTYYGQPTPFSGLSIDSRTIQPGQCFVAISGERLNGHDYIAAAIAAGASSLVISQPECRAQCPADFPILVVEDTTRALGQLAQQWRQQFNYPVIAMTGSCGKTSTKELTRAIFDTQGQVLATVGTLNNHWGVPLTLMNMTAAHSSAIIEMGANQAGEIDYLTQLAQPNITLITNVAPVHLEGFKTVETIAFEKGRIYAHLKPGDYAIVNRDDPFYETWMAAMPAGVHCLTFGRHEAAQVRATDILIEAGCAQFTLNYEAQSVPIKLAVLGEHHIANALAASAIGIAAKISLSAIQRGLAMCQGAPGRMQAQTGKKGVQVVDDSYNANPTAVKAAINFLADCQGETMLILGDMAELGEATPDLHAEVGAYAKSKGIAQFWAVGQQCQHAIKKFGPEGRWFADKSALITALEAYAHEALTILVKGSRSSQMEVVVNALTSE